MITFKQTFSLSERVDKITLNEVALKSLLAGENEMQIENDFMSERVQNSIRTAL